jgi:hypothetical protein
MIYIFNFRYKPDTELNILYNFIKLNKLKWCKREIGLNDDIIVQFKMHGIFDLKYDFKDIQSAGIIV